MEQTPLPVPASAPKPRGASAGSILLVVAALVAVAGVTFAVGRMTAPTSSGAGNRNVPGNGAFPGGSFRPQGSFAPGGIGGLGAGSLTIEGTVASVADGEVTVKLSSGTTMQVKTDSSTTYHRAATASSSDVTVGSTVKVQVGSLRGGPNADGNGAQGAPGATPDPNATPNPNGILGSQTASDITVVGP
jgi:hypothetical protein